MAFLEQGTTSKELHLLLYNNLMVIIMREWELEILILLTKKKI